MAPDDIAKSIVLEAAELLEHFQWDSSNRKDIKSKNIEEIAAEAADVFVYLHTFCLETGIDLPAAVEKKLLHLEKKYPKEEFAKGHNEEAYLKHKKEYRESKK